MQTLGLKPLHPDKKTDLFYLTDTQKDLLIRILGAQSYEKVTAFNQSPNFSMNVSGYDFNGNAPKFSIEAYLQNDMEGLKVAVDKFHSLG
ncbi:hypothetical protein C9994_02275 [Marivirga lumbricoides]|uniref:Uncharacterized protein n=1 Tax=Marivirga lumbricoides TaxID=1046115 RepID=A0A2T4DUM6_9BACT|nr:hypothetical protein C9994_02275 [Marivirga lumbricoides]